jgi:hypothetical protein
MKRTILLGIPLAFLFLGWLCAPASAQETVINSGFELQNTLYYQKFGNVPSGEYGVKLFDTTGSGSSYAFFQVVYDGVSGGLNKTVYLFAGVTYDVSADICYHNC